MSECVQYITNDRGERVGVLLDIEAYQRLLTPNNLDAEYLSGLSIEELQALAESNLATPAQVRLNELLATNVEHRLSSNDVAELNDSLAQVDQLTILKARARYTLNRLQASISAA
jgi:molybdenum cofactor biosynthesis enzyme MoaA